MFNQFMLRTQGRQHNPGFLFGPFPSFLPLRVLYSEGFILMQMSVSIIFLPFMNSKSLMQAVGLFLDMVGGQSV